MKCKQTFFFHLQSHLGDIPNTYRVNDKNGERLMYLIKLKKIGADELNFFWQCPKENAK